MKYSLNAPIEYNALHRGYYYSKPNYRIPAGFSGAEDLLALSMAKSILSLYKKTPIYHSARNLLDCISAPLAAEKEGWYQKRIVVSPVPSAAVAPEIWNLISAGLRENRILSFNYQGGVYKSNRVRPYQLLFDTGVWYLCGVLKKRTWELSRK
jgi:predicted DNA-binding transcriptional regulator YafY